MADASDSSSNKTENDTATNNSNNDNDNNSINNSKSNNNLGAACFRCRGFRHACDRQKPACSRCRRRGITCTYPEAAPTLKKLQKATETLGDRIRKFGDRLKSAEGARDFKATISLQRLAQRNASVDKVESTSSPAPSISEEASDTRSDTRSSVSIASSDITSDDELQRKRGVASTSNFSVYPCGKCYKDLQQCDLTLPRCSRCEANNFECIYMKTEPKANHVSQVLTTMNKIMDQWQESIDRMAKDFAQKTRDFGQRANNSFKMKPLQPFAWKITSTGRGLSVESNVNSYNDLSKLVDQFKKSMHISPAPHDKDNDIETDDGSPSLADERQRIAQSVELDDTSSIHTSSGFSFAVWNSWSHPTHALPQDYPIDISDELTDNLVDLYCRSPCCSAIRLPIIDTAEFLARYRDPANPPSKVLIYAICAMSARNAFQLHMWSKRPAHESPQYNMGKALSIAYCLKGRELLSECYDEEPSMDNCRAAILLSYCSYQNGYSGVIYIYEWIAYSMARELGLYDSNRQFTESEAKLVWCMYYFNTWYRVLQGGSSASVESSQFYPCCPLPPPAEKPVMMDTDTNNGSPSQELVDYYVWSTWYYMIRLQILRHDVMSRLVAAQDTKSDPNLSLDLLTMQDRLQEFFASLPEEWRNPDSSYVTSPQTGSSTTSSSCGATPPSVMTDDDANDRHNQQHYHIDVSSFARFCIFNVHIYYNINKILLYQAFFPSDHIPSVPFSVQCLYTCIDAANSITQILEYMSQQRDECNVPLIGFLFANIVYFKLLNYQDEKCQDFARQCLQLSVDISKSSITYMYDFERAKTLVSVMEQDVRTLCGPIVPSTTATMTTHSTTPSSFLPPHLQRTNSVDSSSDGWSMWSHNSVPSPPYFMHHAGYPTNLYDRTTTTTAAPAPAPAPTTGIFSLGGGGGGTMMQ
ncbi:hypothetical protein BDB00DRAFT_803513 [Zychaea mexicana]|uniref:uncharacterized protein n=1 Tax=Zychaea mexicana TaxID=64656 RepID=UPI0022FF237C|nr:uncharacterized protein BDB00DRAFT_803513 [Zychaea mexicana]KAI9497655.1 hypothetical protein BDB00DRAFT_803513 [Zychaea mexicana]